MRRSALSRRSARRQDAAAFSLFPFLAVLICTVGALILLLVVITRQARLQAAQEAQSKTAEIRDDLEVAREWAELQISGYQESRQKTEADLAGARLALGHVEEHARRLRDRLARLEAAWNGLEALGSDGLKRRERLGAELDQLKHEIAKTETELEKARQEADRRSRSYAVVPYEGPHQTRRRPIYLECRRETVVLQPEGIVLDEGDFRGPLGPGNPLDVALRAVREYLLRHQRFNPDDSGEPYPLLLVRPAGIEVYYLARAAMKSWASEFGYELIGEDWNLDFPSPDPEMAEEVHQAVATARVRQQRLIAAAPSRYRASAPRRYVVSPYRGGLVPDPNSPPNGDGGFGQPRPFGPVGRRFGSETDTPADPGSGRRRSVLDPARGDMRTDTAAEPGFGHQGAATGWPSMGTTGDLAEPETGAPGPPGEDSSRRPPSDQTALNIDLGANRPQSLARLRGRNWGLPHATVGSVPVTCPIRIDCYPDRLVLVPEKGLGRAHAIPLGPRTEDAIDALVSAIWKYVELWGSAGNGMYWRPVLNLRVASNAEARYADLKALLKGSGLEVGRKEDR